MAIPGAGYVSNRRIHAIVGMRYYLSHSASGRKKPGINFLVTGVKPDTYYMHMIPMNTSSTSEWGMLWKAVMGKQTVPGARNAAIALAKQIVESNGAFCYLEIADGRYRKWTSIEFVDLGSKHPGVARWPEKALPGDDLFAVDSTVLAEKEPAVCDDGQAPDLSDL